jgi:hypothetical protein
MFKVILEIDGVHITLEGSFFDIIALIRRALSYVPEAAATIKFVYQGKEITMLEITDTQQAEVGLVIKNKKGGLASVDGVPVWKSTDEGVATVENLSADGMNGTIVAHTGGICQITVEADADLGVGVVPIIGFLDVKVIGGQATIIELVPGAISEQP